jgi:ABC-type phosphate transport system permease subunit
MVKPIVELLAALPSVVIGFFGMVVLAPFLQEILDIPTGLNLFNASLMLAFMSIPTICSISEDAIFSVPIELKEASLALGAYARPSYLVCPGLLARLWSCSWLQGVPHLFPLLYLTR